MVLLQKKTILFKGSRGSNFSRGGGGGGGGGGSRVQVYNFYRNPYNL